MTTFFKVVKGMDGMPETLKLDFVQQVCERAHALSLSQYMRRSRSLHSSQQARALYYKSHHNCIPPPPPPGYPTTLSSSPPLLLSLPSQVSAMHMRVVDGVGTQLQMQGMVCKLANIARDSPSFGMNLGGGGGAAAGR